MKDARRTTYDGNEGRANRRDTPTDPEGGVLSLDEYLAMQPIGDRTRIEIVYRLVHSGSTDPTELNAVMGVDDSTLQYHLNKLVDVGLVERHKRTERDSEGLCTYYRATMFAETILEHGVEELLRREWDFKEAYSSTAHEETG